MKITKKIAAIAAAAMVLSSVPLIAFAGDDTCNGNTSLVNIDDANQHKVTCDGEECPIHGNAESPVKEDHNFGAAYTPANNGDTKQHKQTCDCGYEKVTACSGSTWGTTANGHEKKCDDCEQVIETKAHTATGAYVTTDDDKHWKACEVSGCSVHVDEAEHTWADKSNASGHYKECTGCGKTTTPTAHTAAANAAWLDDGANHYKTCSVAGCSEKVDSATHSAGSFKKDATNHWKECTTCKKVSDKAEHSAANATWKKSTTEHWQLCECGAAVNADEHSFETNNENKEICSECGYENETAATDTKPAEGTDTESAQPHQHEVAETYSSDAENHWKACTADNCTTDGKVNVAAHTWGTGDDANKCTVCNYVKTPTPPEDDDDDVTPPADDVVTPPAADDDVTPPAADDDITPPADDNNNAVVDDNTSTDTTTGASSSSGAAEAVTVSTPAQITATRNPVLTVNAAEAPVSSDMLDAFVKNDDAKTLTLSYSTALKIAIDKDDVSDTSADLDISVSTEGFLPAKEVKKLDATKVVQIDLEGEGKIEGVDKVTVKYRVGAKLAGKEVTVYEYVNGKLVKIGTGKITANGFVNFKTDHYGQFVIAVE